MPASLRPLSTGELLDRTFTVYRKNLLLFAGIAFLPYAAVLVGRLVFYSGLRTSVGAKSAIIFGVGGVIVGIASLVAGAFTQAASTYAVSAIYLEQPVTVGSAYAAVSNRVMAALGITLSLIIAIMMGLILLIVPGILVIAWYSLAIPATVLEKRGVFKSFARSKQLSSGSGGRVLLVYLLVIILYYAFAFGLGAGAGAVLGAIKHMAWLPMISQVIGFFLQVVGAPIITIALTLLYYDQRVRKEAFDLEHMMSALQTAIGASAATAAGTAL